MKKAALNYAQSSQMETQNWSDFRVYGTKAPWFSCFTAMDGQNENIIEHPNNSNIRCSPQDKRCIQKTLARHPSKSTNQRSNTAREETKAVLVR